MTSTTSPLCSSTYCSVFGGSIRSPLAVRMLMSLLLTWFPATPKRGTGTQSLGRFSLCFISCDYNPNEFRLFAGWSISSILYQMNPYQCGEKNNTFGYTCIASYCFLQTSPYMTPGHLCSVPMAEAPDDAMSKCSGDIQGEGPASRHKTTRKKHNQMIIFCRSTIIWINRQRVWMSSLRTCS